MPEELVIDPVVVVVDDAELVAVVSEIMTRDYQCQVERYGNTCANS